MPTLKSGDTVLMDNLAASKMAGVRQASKAARAKLVDRSTYSPDVNSIEKAFFKLKSLLHSVAARTVLDLWAAIREAITRLKPTSAGTTSTPTALSYITMRHHLSGTTAACSD